MQNLICKIDHAAPDAVPASLCRACSPPVPYVGEHTTQHAVLVNIVRPDNLTDADRRAIAEIEAGDKRKAKKAESLATMKAKAGDRLNADAGGRWDSRLARWVTDEEELARAKRRMAQNAAARRKLKRPRRVVDSDKITTVTKKAKRRRK